MPLSTHEMTLRPLFRTDAVFSGGFNLVFFAGMEIVLGLEQLASSSLTTSWRPGNQPLLGGSLICLGVVSAVRFVLLMRGFAVSADEEGLNWRERGRRQRILWQDIRSLSALYLPETATPNPRPPRRIYLLDTGSTMLTWAPSVHGRHKGQDVDPSWLLCRLVVTRTGLPLRELNPGVARIVAAQNQRNVRTAWREILSAIVGDAPTRREQRLRIASAFVPFGLAVLLVISLIATGVAVLKWQPRAYADRLAAARASTPLLRDPLAKDTGLWPVAPDGHLSFTNSAYTLQASDENASFGWAPRIFGDVALEVTMRHTVDDDLDNAGIILRADDASQKMTVFMVTPSGEWRLVRLPMTSPDELGNGRDLMEGGILISEGAIHQGLDAANRLAVIMHGSSYAFFINDQYVGAYHDDGGPTRGHIGMYVDGYSGTAGYTNLAVYPAPPPTLLAPI